MVNVGQYDVDRSFETTVLVQARTPVFAFYVVCIKQIKQKGYFLYFLVLYSPGNRVDYSE